MHWLIYTTAPDGRLASLRIVEMDDKPVDALVINGGFQSAEEGLALMSHWLRIGPDGFAGIDPERARHAPSWLDRVRIAYTIEARIVWLIGLALGIGVVGLAISVVLLAMHLG